jgi:hypothetical protein
MVELSSLPFRLTDADTGFYVSEFARGGLNWYRNIDLPRQAGTARRR